MYYKQQSWNHAEYYLAMETQNVGVCYYKGSFASRYHTGFPLFWKKKNPGVFQSNFRIFQLLLVIYKI